MTSAPSAGIKLIKKSRSAADFPAERFPALLSARSQVRFCLKRERRCPFEEATSIEDAGVNEAYVYIGEEKETKVFGNGMVDPEKVVGCDLSEAWHS